MPASWKDGLVNAFPIPQDRLKSKKASRKDNKNKNESGDTFITPIVEADETATFELEGDPFPFFELPAEIRNRKPK